MLWSFLNRLLMNWMNIDFFHQFQHNLNFFNPDCTAYLGRYQCTVKICTWLRHFYLPPRCRPGDGRYCNAPHLSVCPSRLVFALTRKRFDVFSRNFAVRAPCHGGVMYSFWWNVWFFYEFFKYLKKKKTFFSPIFSVFFAFYAISKIPGGGGGGGGSTKTILSHFISGFMLFSTLKQNWKYLKVPLHLLVKWEVVSPNSR